MSKELELWTFIAERLRLNERVVFLVVAESSGSSPGRAGYKMAVAASGELCGSIGGGVMEVRLVEHAKTQSREVKSKSELIEQVHRKNLPNASGMICSGKQTVIIVQLSDDDLPAVESTISSLAENRRTQLTVTGDSFTVGPSEDGARHSFERREGDDFLYTERLGAANHLFIIGGGHCALALSELMTRLDFKISIFDDRPSLNTLDKNEFADEITIINSYDKIAAHVPNGGDVYIVVMTLGYASDAVVIRQLLDHDVKYLGVLGSKAKMATLMKALKGEGFGADKLARIRTPIGIQINSRTPEEIAISIAAEIIAIKNA